MRRAAAALLGLWGCSGAGDALFDPFPGAVDDAGAADAVLELGAADTTPDRAELEGGVGGAGGSVDGPGGSELDHFQLADVAGELDQAEPCTGHPWCYVDAGDIADRSAGDEPRPCDLTQCDCKSPSAPVASCCDGPCPGGFAGLTCYCHAP